MTQIYSPKLHRAQFTIRPLLLDYYSCLLAGQKTEGTRKRIDLLAAFPEYSFEVSFTDLFKEEYHDSNLTYFIFHFRFASRQQLSQAVILCGVEFFVTPHLTRSQTQVSFWSVICLVKGFYADRDKQAYNLHPYYQKRTLVSLRFLFISQ